MADKAKFEEMLEHLVNNDREKAEELFHEIVVEKSRDIYENLLADDVEDKEVEEKMHDKKKMKKDDEDVEEASKDEDKDVEEASKDEEKDDKDDKDVKEDFDLDEFEVEGDDDIDPMMGGDAADDMEMDMGDAEGGDMDMDMEGGDEEPATKGDVKDLEAELEDLKAEFEDLMQDKEEGDEEGEEEMGDEEGEEEMGDEEGEEEPEEAFAYEGSDEEVDEKATDKSATEQMREYVEKVTPKMGDNGANTKSPVAGANDMGGTASNLVQGGDEKGMKASAPKEDSAGNVNVPGGKASKSMTSMPKGHGAEKKSAGDAAPDKKSMIGS